MEQYMVQDSSPIQVQRTSPRDVLKRFVQSAAGRFGYEVRAIDQLKTHVPGLAHSRIHVDATYSPWLADAAFQEIYTAVSGHTLVDRYRCYELWQLVGEAAKLDRGDLLEVGAFRGGSGCLIAAKACQVGLSDAVYLCDTFQGVVKVSERDPCYTGGEHNDTSYEMVTDLARSLHLGNVKVLQGIFPDDTGHFVKDREFRFCHIDVDAYQSARDVAEWVWHRLVPGGIVVYDDFGFNGTEGVTQFVNEERNRRDRIVIHNLNGHAVVVRVA
jgi:O-methyltransferase